MHIKKEDITFICTGKIITKGRFKTKTSLMSVRKFFKESTIVLSIWENEDISNLDGLYDILVINPKMELKYNSFLDSVCTNRYNTYELQQKLVSEGLKKAKTKYATRLRSDFILKSDSFLKNYSLYLKDMPCLNDSYKIFKQKVLIPSVITFYPYCNYRVHFPSDIFHFGLREDLSKIWNGDTLKAEEANFFKEHPNIETLEGLNHRYCVEQSLWFNILDKAKIQYEKPDYFYSINKNMQEETNLLFLSNFFIDDIYRMSIKSKFTYNDYNGCIYTFNQYEKEYRKYCDINYVIKTIPLKENKLLYAKLRFLKHINRLLDVERNFHKRLEELFIGIPYTSLFFLWTNIIRYSKKYINK